jgi:hypothetical protein
VLQGYRHACSGPFRDAEREFVEQVCHSMVLGLEHRSIAAGHTGT